MYFHHNWPAAGQAVESAFPAIRQHVLLPWATSIPEAGGALRRAVSETLLANLASLVPPEWMHPATAQGYVDFFLRRLSAADRFVEEAERAHASLF